MSEADRRLWPFKPRASLIAAGVLLVGLLIVVAVLRAVAGWPGERSETAVLLGIVLVSALPIVLVLLDAVMMGGGVIEVRGVKLDFSHVRAAGTSGVTVPANVGVRGQPVADSGTTEIMEALRQATASDIVVVDLEEGQAWWETRLLVLLSGAERLGRPEVVVFVGTEGGKPNRFQGWGYAADLLRALVRADRRYPHLLQRARAAGRQWDLVEPPPLADPPLPPPDAYPWMVGHVSTERPWMVFDAATGDRNDLFVEQTLANELGELIEQEEGARRVTLVRMEELFRPLLHRERVDQSWPSERQVEHVFESDAAYLALTERGAYVGLVSRLTMLNEFVRSLAVKTDA